jgi:hypothetical protein
LAKQNLKKLITGVKKRSELLPSEKDMINPQLPLKHKVTFFDRDASSANTSSTTLSKKQKKSMIRELFSSNKLGFSNES